MESSPTHKMAPVENMQDEVLVEEVKQVWYPAEECLGATVQCGRIAPESRFFNAGSN